MTNFVRVTDNYDMENDNFYFSKNKPLYIDHQQTREEIIPVDRLVKIYKYKCGSHVIAYEFMRLGHSTNFNAQARERSTTFYEIFKEEWELEEKFNYLERILCGRG